MEWGEKGAELVNCRQRMGVFRSGPGYQKFLDRLNPLKPPKYSRAVLETLAIIRLPAPVTRGDTRKFGSYGIERHTQGARGARLDRRGRSP